MLEKEIEAYLRKECKKRDWICYKFISPQNKGVPDRIVINNYGAIIFVELKNERGRLSLLQQEQIRRLQDHGCHVSIIYTLEDVDMLIESMESVRGEWYAV